MVSLSPATVFCRLIVPALLKVPLTVELPATLNTPLLPIVVAPIEPAARETVPPLVRAVMPVTLLPPTASVAPLAFVNVLSAVNGPVTVNEPALLAIAPFHVPCALTRPVLLNGPVTAPVVVKVPALVIPVDVRE